MTAQERAAAALQGDYAFPRELYETEAQWRAQAFFQRHPEALPK